MRLYLRDVLLDRQAADVISRLGDEPYKRASRRGVTPEMNVDELFQELRDLFEENHLDFVFSLWYLAPRSLALEVFKSPILLLQLLP